MSKGYLLFAIDTDEVDYNQLAYACALSIKRTQTMSNVSIITNNVKLVSSFKPVFDHIIEYNGPLGMDARSRAYDYTPYDETVLLDSDMLFLKDMTHYWDFMSSSDLLITSSPQNYRSEPIKYGYYRKVFEYHKLLDVYSAWTYFRKSDVAYEFFDLVKTMTDNPTPFIRELIPASISTSLPTDEAFSLAISILSLEDSAVTSFPKITHMKGMVQGWNGYVQDWTERIRFTIDEQYQIKLGVWNQFELLHYVNKDLITDRIIQLLENNI